MVGELNFAFKFFFSFVVGGNVNGAHHVVCV